MKDPENFPVGLAIAEKYANNIRFALRIYDGADLSKLIIDEHRKEYILSSAEKSKIKRCSENLDFFLKLLEISGNIAEVINEEGTNLEADVEGLNEVDKKSAIHFFIKRTTDVVYDLFMSLRMGIFDIEQETKQLLLISNFAHGYCLDLILQLSSSLLKTESSSPEKTH
jgi:hypothetical protein